ncbi:MAG TPA: glutathione-disulfide reductase, partial [Paracoccaceae bacterium]|nr:glutathione-disulfide reductase [Paracoccaceae bacterium]
MAEFDFDLFVIGGGSGGVRAGRMAADSGARVGVAEEYRYGGTCVIRGCVPKKLFVYASQFSEAFEDAKGFGWTLGEARFDWAAFIAAKDREVARLEGLYRAGLERAGARPFAARAVILDPHRVRLSTGETFRARHLLVATGGHPVMPAIPGAEHAISSNEIFHLPALPRRIVIVGGGYVACEFACILHGLGAAVTLLYRGDLVLRGFDDDVRAHVQAAMEHKGIALRLLEQVAALEKRGGGLVARLASGVSLEADQVMFATGRQPNTEGLGLAEAGVRRTANGAVAVDEWSQSSVPSIFAVGDVTDRRQLTPVAIREGAAFVETVFRANPTRADHALVPSAVFTQPEIGTVGLSEAEARAKGAVQVYRTTFRPLLHTLSGRDEPMLMKLVVASDSRKVLGCHIVGHAAAEMIQLAAVALRMGATKEDFDRTVAVHP